MKTISLIGVSAAIVLLSGCCGKQFSEGSYGYDLNFLKDNNVKIVELASANGQSRLIVSGELQGRVLTSSADGLQGQSFGWINRKHIAEGMLSDPLFNVNGGEERIWIGPELGPFSFFYPSDSNNEVWQVPSFLDTVPYDVVETCDNSVTFTKTGTIVNCNGLAFDICLDRTVRLANRSEIPARLGVSLPDEVKAVAYETVSTITNVGDRAWERESGVPCIWLLGCYNPSATATVLIPYEENAEGPVMTPNYQLPLGPDRLKAEDGVVYYLVDGNYRSKMGVPKERAKDVIGSYDPEAKVLNIIKLNRPEGECEYVNELPSPQEDPFNGDVINSYNDGPSENGVLLGPFFEIETSSPAAFLAPGETLTHTQFTVHLEGPEDVLSSIMEVVFGTTASKVASAF